MVESAEGRALSTEAITPYRVGVRIDWKVVIALHGPTRAIDIRASAQISGAEKKEVSSRGGYCPRRSCLFLCYPRRFKIRNVSPTVS